MLTPRRIANPQDAIAYIVSRGSDLLPAQPSPVDIYAAAQTIAGEMDCGFVRGGRLGNQSIAIALATGGRRRYFTTESRRYTSWEHNDNWFPPSGG